MDGLVNAVAVDEFVMGALLGNSADNTAEEMPRVPQERLQLILDRALELGETTVEDKWNEMMLSLLSGNTIILVDGCSKAIVGGTKGENGGLLRSLPPKL